MSAASRFRPSVFGRRPVPLWLRGAQRASQAPGGVGQAIVDVSKRLVRPWGLAALRIDRSKYESFIDGAMADHTHKTNPRLATREDYSRMLDDSM